MTTLEEVARQAGLGGLRYTFFMRFFARRFPEHVRAFSRFGPPITINDPGYAATWARRFADDTYSEWWHGDSRLQRVLQELAPGAYPPPE